MDPGYYSRCRDLGCGVDSLETVDWFRVGGDIFSSPKRWYLFLGLTRPPISWIRGALPMAVKQQDLEWVAPYLHSVMYLYYTLILINCLYLFVPSFPPTFVYWRGRDVKISWTIGSCLQMADVAHYLCSPRSLFCSWSYHYNLLIRQELHVRG